VRRQYQRLLKSLNTALTSKVTVETDSKSWYIFIPIVPVPASRPRFARTGRVYYAARYVNFRKQADILLTEAPLPPQFPLENPVAVTVTFIIPSPKKTKRMAPRGDIDNYFKSLDVLNEVVWKDDDQIVWTCATKEYGDSPGIRLEVIEIERIPETRSLPELQVERQSR